MGRGNDRLRLINLAEMFVGEFNIESGSGDDSLEFKYVGLESSPMAIETGSGNDNLTIYQMHGRRDVTISTQSGDDHVSANRLQVYSNDEPTQLALSFGSGDDSLSASHLSFDGYAFEDESEFVIDSGSGADRLLFEYVDSYQAQSQIITGSGNDLLAFSGEDESGYFDRLLIDLGTGADQMYARSLFGDTHEFNSGLGNDTILIETGQGVRVDKQSIAMGNGRDVLAIGGAGTGDFEMGSFQSNLGGQNDVLYLMTDLPLSGSINGGSGFDTFQEDLSVLIHLQPESFEDILPDQPLAVIWAGLYLNFLDAWAAAEGNPGDL